MSRDGSCELTWGGDLRRFRLGIDQLLALQERCGDSGPLEVARRLRTGAWRLGDITDTMRMGLIGAGMDGAAAKALVDRVVAPPDIAVNALPAYCVIMSALYGPEDTPVGKPGAGGMKPDASPPQNSTAEAQ